MVVISGTGVFETSDWTGASTPPPAVFTISGFISIADETVKDNTAITSVTIGTSVESIGVRAFSGCSALTTVTFAAGSELTTIGTKAFKDSGLIAVAIPANVTSIGNHAFRYCSALTTVTFAAGSELTTIGIGAFQQSGLTAVAIPAKVTSFSTYAFYQCSALTTVTFAAGSELTAIGEYAFYQSGLTAVAIPANVTSIGQYAFYDCIALTNVTFAAGSDLTTIGTEAFQQSGLLAVEIPAKVTSIDNDAFRNCNTLTTVTIATGGLLAVMGTNVFQNSGLTMFGASQSVLAALVLTVGVNQTVSGSPSVVTVYIYTTPGFPTCFPSGTPIQTDQGEIMIEYLTNQNTIRDTPVIRVTRSTGHRSVISLPRNSLYKNVPSQDTYCSLEHKVFHNGKMTKARDLVNKCDHVTKIPHDGAPLYNVLLPTHSRMVVNNLIAETLHPQNAAARASLRAPPASVRR